MMEHVLSEGLNDFLDTDRYLEQIYIYTYNVHLLGDGWGVCE